MLFRFLHTLSILTGPNIFLSICILFYEMISIFAFTMSDDGFYLKPEYLHTLY